MRPPLRSAPAPPCSVNACHRELEKGRVAGCTGTWMAAIISYIISCPVDRYITAIRGSESRWTFQLHFILDSTFLVSSTTPRERTTKELKYNKQRRRAALASLPGCADLGPPVTFIIRTYSSNTEQSKCHKHTYRSSSPGNTAVPLDLNTPPYPSTQCCSLVLIDRSINRSLCDDAALKCKFFMLLSLAQGPLPGHHITMTKTTLSNSTLTLT